MGGKHFEHEKKHCFILVVDYHMWYSNTTCPPFIFFQISNTSSRISTYDSRLPLLSEVKICIKKLPGSQIPLLASRLPFCLFAWKWLFNVWLHECLWMMMQEGSNEVRDDFISIQSTIAWIVMNLNHNQAFLLFTWLS